MEKINIGNSFAEVAHQLRKMAELTASCTQNWDNYEEILKSAIMQAYEHGKKEKPDA